MLSYRLLKAQISNKKLKVKNLSDLRDYARAVDPYGVSPIFAQEYINTVWNEVRILESKLWVAWVDSDDGKRFIEACLRPIKDKLQESSYIRQLFTVERL
jgi:hypothetical protein